MNEQIKPDHTLKNNKAGIDKLSRANQHFDSLENDLFSIQRHLVGMICRKVTALIPPPLNFSVLFSVQCRILALADVLKRVTSKKRKKVTKGRQSRQTK